MRQYREIAFKAKDKKEAPTEQNCVGGCNAINTWLRWSRRLRVYNSSGVSCL